MKSVICKNHQATGELSGSQSWTERLFGYFVGAKMFLTKPVPCQRGPTLSLGVRTVPGVRRSQPGSWRKTFGTDEAALRARVLQTVF